MNKTPVIFINRTLLIDDAQVDRMVQSGDVQMFKSDGSDYAVSTAFIDLHLDAEACKGNWFGMKGRCKLKPKKARSEGNSFVNHGALAPVLAPAFSFTNPAAVATAGVVATGGILYVARKMHKRAHPEDLLKGLHRSEIGGPLSHQSVRAKARSKASKAAYGTSNNSTYFSAGAGKDPRPGMGKGSMSETIGGIASDVSVREARRLKTRAFWNK